jgi:cupin 2 domain-containing protein
VVFDLTNIFSNIPNVLAEELFTSIIRQDNVHIERIVSSGHITQPQQWYDQAWDEWVIVLEGQAVLVYEHDMSRLSMMTGDYVFIPAHTRHRVEWTAPKIHTVWLAVHLYKSNVG